MTEKKEEAPEGRDIERRLENLPTDPGVYMMKDSGGEILYVGKAKNLRSRVRSYFSTSGDGRYSVRYLATKTADIDVIVTNNEKEALFLEDTLLKKHKPRYNIRLKDSKTYVSIRISVNEKFPRIMMTRKVRKDGARYFGPYVSARAVRETIKFLRGIFPLCTCSPAVFRNRSRPCLDYQLGLCSAPAVGLVSEEDYRELVNGAILFLEGKNTELLKDLKARMKGASEGLDFERAARLRDRVHAIEEMLEEQRVVSHRFTDRDVIGMERSGREGDGGTIAFQVLLVRDGRLADSRSFFFDDAGLPDTEVLSSFLAQFYRGGRYVPEEVIVPVKLDDTDVLEEWLAEKKEKKVPLIAPVRGEKRKLLEMARSNAAGALKKKTEEAAHRADPTEELRRRLHLAGPPEVIEAFDISNMGGAHTVGAMVKFRGGEPDKSGYRLYRLRTTGGPGGPDDYASMEEVLSRRYGKGGEAELPDLILMDGGKGQLNIALRVLEELGVVGKDGPAVAALAKDRPSVEEARAAKRAGRKPPSKGERVFLPNVKDPVLLREGSRPDLFLRRIRDEVHRFAITYHRKLRSKGVGSVLEDVPGVGAKRSKALLDRFGDIRGVASATVEEVMEVPGVTEELAREIRERAAEAAGESGNGDKDGQRGRA